MHKMATGLNCEANGPAPSGSSYSSLEGKTSWSQDKMIISASSWVTSLVYTRKFTSGAGGAAMVYSKCLLLTPSPSCAHLLGPWTSAPNSATMPPRSPFNNCFAIDNKYPTGFAKASSWLRAPTWQSACGPECRLRTGDDPFLRCINTPREDRESSSSSTC